MLRENAGRRGVGTSAILSVVLDNGWYHGRFRWVSELCRLGLGGDARQRAFLSQGEVRLARAVSGNVGFEYRHLKLKPAVCLGAMLFRLFRVVRELAGKGCSASEPHRRTR